MSQISKKYREDYRSFYLKKRTWEAICSIRGWHGRGSIVRFAEDINITKQYASCIVSGSMGCSSNIMRKIIQLMGVENTCWCHLFETRNLRHIDPNHPLLNQEKYDGVVPYEPYSESRLFRSKEYKAESRPGLYAL